MCAMQSLLIILPDFLIILLGALLAQRFGFGAAFWKPAEKLVFYVLFPPLLFNSIAGAKMTIAAPRRFSLRAWARCSSPCSSQAFS